MSCDILPRCNGERKMEPHGTDIIEKKGTTKDKRGKNINSTTKGRRLTHPLLLPCIGGQEVKMQPLSWPGRMSSLRWWRIRCRKSLLEGTSVVQSRALAQGPCPLPWSRHVSGLLHGFYGFVWFLWFLLLCHCRLALQYLGIM